MIPLQWLLRRLRWPTAGEVVGGMVVAALLGLAFTCGQRSGPVDVQEVQVVRYDTVTVERIRAQEPPAQPSLLHRAAYRDVQPTRVAVAPGAGRELLAAVCDTVRTVRDSVQSPALPDMPPPDVPRVAEKPPAPALPYTEKGHRPWTPWGAYTFTRTLVGRDGMQTLEFKVKGDYEVRYLPEFTIREQRAGIRWLKPAVYTAGVFAAGWVAHSFATQF